MHRADLIVVMFDAHKLDISDELKIVIDALRPHHDKMRYVQYIHAIFRVLPRPGFDLMEKSQLNRKPLYALPSVHVVQGAVEQGRCNQHAAADACVWCFDVVPG